MQHSIFKGLGFLTASASVLVAVLALYQSPAARSAAAPQFRFPATTEASLDALESKALRHGSVPVIVAFDADTAPPQTLSAVERAAQRAAIAEARRDLLDDLAGHRLEHLKVSAEMPLIAFHATAREISRLADSDGVVSVTEDREIPLDVVRGIGQSPRGAVEPPPGTLRPDTIPGPAATSANGWTTQLEQWWDYKRLGLDTTRTYGWTGAGQTVAILDTGVDRNHAWISGRVVNEACFSTRTIGSTAGDCPNGTYRQYGAGAAAPCSFSNDCAHGTHVAHTAAGLYGVAPDARIIAVQIFHRHPTSGRPTYFESDLTWALSHVYSLRSTYRIAAINMSIGGVLFAGYCDNVAGDSSSNATYLTSWITSLKAAGIATVISSGNDNASNAVSHPACISPAISVGNTTLDAAGSDAVFGNAWNSYTSRYTGSNSNLTLDLLAPGTDICSAVPTWQDTDGTRDGIDCGWIGTSMAAPHVAGAIAVLRQFRPASTFDQVYNALRASGPMVVDSRNNLQTPRIHVWNALYKI